MKHKFLKLFVGLLFIGIFLILFSPNQKIDAVEDDREREFRATWISPVHGDDISYTNENAFKVKMTQLLDILEYYHLNAMIFHVRTYNDAFYKTNLSPKMAQLGNPNFTNFDPLKWLISEAHKRGIEFHAWLNPYRVKSSGVSDLNTVAASYAAYPENPASDVNNLLKTASNGAVLNPGIPAVREFIGNTVREIVENYEVDAIHFDDYFYSNMGANGNLKPSNGDTILNEADQKTFEKYGSGYTLTSPDSKANWRRAQVNLLIQSLDSLLNNYNLQNEKNVQFGISPTGIYRNGNGVVTYQSDGKPVTTGSSTGGQEHYASYLFCDSLHWISMGWLDYILPQSYWSQSYSAAQFAKVVGWWDKVCKNLPVNLYAGIGLYRANDAGSTDNGWETNVNELSEQLNYVRSSENVSGASIYKFGNLKESYQYAGSTPNMVVQNVAALREKVWKYPVVLPELKSFPDQGINNPAQFTNHHDNSFSFKSVEGAKFYYIYKSLETVKYSKETLYRAFTDEKDILSFIDQDKSNAFKYGVRVLSRANDLSDGTSDYFDERPFTEGKEWSSLEFLKKDLIADFNAIKGTSYTLQDYINHASTGYNWFAATDVSTKTFFQSVAMREKYRFLLEVLKQNRQSIGLPVTGFDEIISNGFGPTATYVNMEMIAFISGMKKTYADYSTCDYTKEIYNSNVLKAITQTTYCQIYFYDIQNQLIKYEKVKKYQDATPPILTNTDEIIYLGWDKNYQNVTKSLQIYPLYESKKVSLCTISSYNQNFSFSLTDGIYSGTVLNADYGTLVEVHCEKNDQFMFVTIDGLIYSYDPDFTFYATKNHTIVVYYSLENAFSVAFADSNQYLLDFKNSPGNEVITTSVVPGVKQGFLFNGWEAVSNLSENKIVYATYTEIKSQYEIQINNGFLIHPDSGQLTIERGSVIKVGTDLANFSCWKMGDKILSYQKELSISVYGHLELTASDESLTSKDLIENVYILKSENNFQFSAKFEFISAHNFIEVGIIYHRNLSDPLLVDENSSKRIMKFNADQEFVFSINLEREESFTGRFYLVTENNGNMITTYSAPFSEINESYGKIQYVTNGGKWLLYPSHQELVNDFIEDLNTYRMSLNIVRAITKENFFADTYHASIFFTIDFLTISSFSEKYLFLRDFILNAARSSGYMYSNALSSNNNLYWRCNLDAFLNQRTYIHASDSTYNSMNSDVLIHYQSAIEQPLITQYPFGTEFILPILSKEGFTFAGWFETADFSGTVISHIPSNAAKDYILYAKFI